MVAYEVLPIIPLPYDTVPICGRKLQIAAVNRPDIVAIVANFYNGAFGNKSKDHAASIGCVPLRSPYLSPDGQKLIESGKASDKEPAVPDPAHASRDDLFNFGVVAKIQGIEGGKTGEIKLILDCTTRFKLGKITQDKPYLEGRCEIYKDEGMTTDSSTPTALGLADVTQSTCGTLLSRAPLHISRSSRVSSSRSSECPV